MRSVAYLLLFVVLGFYMQPADAQSRPAFCEPIPDALLGGLVMPYAVHTAPDGTVYCEGLIRNPIALQPPTVVSLKQDQTEEPTFERDKTGTLTWCDDSNNAVRLSLRSLVNPLFALDAMHYSNRFEWRTDLVAEFQPNWSMLGALGSREIPIMGHDYQVLVPLRNGNGYSSDYVFVVHSKDPIYLTKALIEPIAPPRKPVLTSVRFSNGPSKDSWFTDIPFKERPEGIYQITFEESIRNAGATAEPVFILHKKCTTK